MTDWLSPTARQRLAEGREASAARQAEGLPIFDAPPHNGTETSRAAAEKVAPHVGTMLHRVLTVVCEHPAGLTRSEIVAIADMPENTVNPRSRTLLDRELLVEDGERDGRAVLKPTAAGFAALGLDHAA